MDKETLKKLREAKKEESLNQENRLENEDDINELNDPDDTFDAFDEDLSELEAIKQEHKKQLAELEKRTNHLRNKKKKRKSSNVSKNRLSREALVSEVRRQMANEQEIEKKGSKYLDSDYYDELEIDEDGRALGYWARKTIAYTSLSLAISLFGLLVYGYQVASSERDVNQSVNRVYDDYLGDLAEKGSASGLNNGADDEEALKALQARIEEEQQRRINQADFDGGVSSASTDDYVQARQYYDETVRNYGIGSVYIPSVGLKQPLLAGTSHRNLLNGVGTASANQRLGEGTFIGMAHEMQNNVLLGPIDRVGVGQKVYFTDFGRVFEYTVTVSETVHYTNANILQDKPDSSPRFVLYRCQGGPGTEYRRVLAGELTGVMSVDQAPRGVRDGLGLTGQNMARGSTEQSRQFVQEAIGDIFGSQVVHAQEDEFDTSAAKESGLLTSEDITTWEETDEDFFADLPTSEEIEASNQRLTEESTEIRHIKPVEAEQGFEDYQSYSWFERLGLKVYGVAGSNYLVFAGFLLGLIAVYFIFG